MLEKREWHYLQSPKQFEISGCDCGNMDVEWSEYKKHMWCSICKKDFIPENNGVFDSPISVNVADMLGIKFDRFNLKTNEIEIFNKTSGFYTRINTTKSILFKNNFIGLLVDNLHHSVKEVILTKEVDVLVIKNIKEIKKQIKFFTTEISLILNFGYPNTKIFILDVDLNKNKLFPKNNKMLDNFKDFCFKNELDYKLEKIDVNKTNINKI